MDLSVTSSSNDKPTSHLENGDGNKQKSFPDDNITTYMKRHGLVPSTSPVTGETSLNLSGHCGRREEVGSLSRSPVHQEVGSSSSNDVFVNNIPAYCHRMANGKAVILDVPRTSTPHRSSSNSLSPPYRLAVSTSSPRSSHDSSFTSLTSSESFELPRRQMSIDTIAMELHQRKRKKTWKQVSVIVFIENKCYLIYLAFQLYVFRKVFETGFALYSMTIKQKNMRNIKKTKKYKVYDDKTQS